MSNSFVCVALPELLLCFFLLLLCRVVLSSSVFVFILGVNCDVSSVVNVTSSNAVSTLDLAVLCSVLIVLMFFSHPMDASRCVSNLSHLIHAQESLRVAIMFSSSCLN